MKIGITRFFPVLLALTAASALSCEIQSQRNFFANFNNDCYYITPALGRGENLAGDLNAIYNLIYFKVDPNYELIAYGYYPDARYFSVSVYDDHSAPLSNLSDANIVPLVATGQNWYAAQTPYVPRQPYALAISLGGAQPEPSAVLPGCSIDGFRIHENTLTGFGRHEGMNWDGDPALPLGFPAHKSIPSASGAFMVRKYKENPQNPQPMRILVRDLRTGCAVPAAEVIDTIVTNDRNLGKEWGDKAQSDAHLQYASRIQTKYCYGPDLQSATIWLRGPDYIKGGNPEAAYMFSLLPGELRFRITGPLSQHVLRIRVRIPKMPSTPCADCRLDGTEEMRYWSLSLSNGATTVLSLSDKELVRDATGHATILLTMGGPRPPQATAENGYTFVDAGGLLDTNQVAAFAVRAILPSSGFRCGANQIPLMHSQHFPGGSFLGEYRIAADLVRASDLPAVAEPFNYPDTCGFTPTELPQSCQSLSSQVSFTLLP